jgi:hypothetical protein
MYALRFLPEAVVDAVEIAELRFESHSLSPVISRIRLCSGELACPSRTVREPFAVNDSLCGKLLGEVVGAFACLNGTRVCGDELAPLGSTFSGSRLGAERLPRYRSAIGDRG